MSDNEDDQDDYEYEYDDDDMEEEDGGNNGGGNGGGGEKLQYTDDEEEQDDAAVALENAYYNAKGNRTVAAFEEVIQLEAAGNNGKAGIWTFKAMKQLFKLHLRGHSNNNHHPPDTTPGGGNRAAVVDDSSSSTSGAAIIAAYERLLHCVSANVSEISPAAVEKGIGSLLERVGGSSSTDPDVARAVYDATLTVFHPVTGGLCKNERLWFKTNLKYGQSLFHVGDLHKLAIVLRELTTHETTSTNTMEIFALQMQLYEVTDTKKLRETFGKAMAVRGGIPHPRTIALIQGTCRGVATIMQGGCMTLVSWLFPLTRTLFSFLFSRRLIIIICCLLQLELGGKMHMQAREYAAAEKTFFQAFKSYDEAGDIGRLRCLKYLVLASMLSTSSINPFDSQEARPYKEDPEIVAMTNLVQAFHDNDIYTFERTLKMGKIMERDDFIRQFVSELLRTIRTQVIINFLRPYRRITLTAIATALNDIPVTEVESLLVNLILDGNVKGKIDATEGILVLDQHKTKNNILLSKDVESQCIAMNKLLDQLAEVSRKVMKENISSSASSSSSSSTTLAGAQLRSVVGL
jgi:COP9 signalosome complex subunit 2